jgi:hypothetical protein
LPFTAHPAASRAAMNADSSDRMAGRSLT